MVASSLTLKFIVLMVFQAFIDDSYNKNGIYCLGGHIASAEAWKNFSAEWEQTLFRFGRLDREGKRHFKMSEMMQQGRIEDVPAFYRIIEDHVLCSLACTYNILELEAAKSRVFVPGLFIDWGFLDNHYLFAFRVLMDMFHNNKDQIDMLIPYNETVDFIFDEQNQKKEILSFWNQYLDERTQETRKRYGAKPRFEDDKKFLPLQAADFWAWWVRKWVEEGSPEKMEDCNFGEWKAYRKNHVKIHISINEDDIVQFIVSYLRDRLPPELFIYDKKFPSFLVGDINI